MEFHFASRQDDVVLKHRQEWRCHGGTGTPAGAIRLTPRNIETRG